MARPEPDPGKTTIYRWYPTKADLFIAIYTIERTASVTVPDSGNCAGLIDYNGQACGCSGVRAMHRRRCRYGALVAEAHRSTRKHSLMLRKSVFPSATADVKRILERARKAKGRKKNRGRQR